MSWLHRLRCRSRFLQKNIFADEGYFYTRRYLKQNDHFWCENSPHEIDDTSPCIREKFSLCGVAHGMVASFNDLFPNERGNAVVRLNKWKWRTRESNEIMLRVELLKLPLTILPIYEGCYLCTRNKQNTNCFIFQNILHEDKISLEQFWKQIFQPGWGRGSENCWPGD